MLPEPEAVPQEPERALSLLAVGDILPHRRVKASALKDGWEGVFGAVSARIREADIAFANLESPIAPDHHKGIHGEVFNAPATLAGGLADAGFDVLSMANNHVWDQGADGMLETRSRVLAAGMQPVGVSPTCELAAAPVIVEVNGVRVAFLALADLLNLDARDDTACVFVPGELCEADCLPDRDALYFPIQVDRVHAAIRRAADQADVVVLSAHWQTEYHTLPLPEYPALARGFIDAGAHVVLGHHPHVLQRIESYEDGVIAYSLGNFVSDMGRRYDPSTSALRRGDTRDGLMLELDIRVRGDQVRVRPIPHPTWVENGDTIAVLPQSKLSEELRSIRAPRVREVLDLDSPIAGDHPSR